MKILNIISKVILSINAAIWVPTALVILYMEIFVSSQLIVIAPFILVMIPTVILFAIFTKTNLIVSLLLVLMTIAGFVVSLMPIKPEMDSPPDKVQLIAYFLISFGFPAVIRIIRRFKPI